MARVEFRGVTKVFGKSSGKKNAKELPPVVAVNNLSFIVEDKEFMVIVGPSGCGKTTTLRMLAGLEKQDSGHILLDNEIVDDVPVGKRNVQMVFQNYALWPHMKVFNEKDLTNISFALKIRNWLPQNIIRQAQVVSQKVGLESQWFNRKPHELSEGQKQRVAIGRSIILTPKVLLLDEPVTNLDPPARVKMRNEIRKLHDDTGMTIIYVTHNMSDAMAMADRIAVMKDGSFIQLATPQELWEHPANEFVKDFIEAYSMARRFGVSH